jgi:hypothetical protein
MHNYNKYSEEALFQMVINDNQYTYTKIYNRYSHLLHSHVFVKLQSLCTVVENASGVHFEMQIDRTKLKGLTDKVMRLGINVVKNDCSASIGFAPVEGDPAFYLNMGD